ncbi:MULTISPECIES: GAF domain-containing sensor histidine kinase [unclassified Variovorax]|uniref:GAF domain-containing sensor histidine kinase n=1 Tax=unclassified Variovorax TaxID=663243 RepID=UPI001BD60536|nr:MULTISPECIES: GAF domain-containing sensor histidine kinase [unclassified Variovorax]
MDANLTESLLIDSPDAIRRDVALIGRISSVPTLLKIICANTGMGFAAVARVTDGTWTACAVQDDIHFGLQPGGQLDVRTTLCIEARAARKPVVFDHASLDPVYRDHHTPRLYNIESYISVPIVRPGGEYFGNLCAIDPRPLRVSDQKTVAMFESFAELIGRQFEQEESQMATETALLDARTTAELREQFIAVLGHDLRNPLASVSALGELLVRRASEPEAAKVGERIRGTTRRMALLIDDVLDFARGRMGSGLVVVPAEVADLGASLSEVVSELQLAHPDRWIDERIDVAADVWCDRGRIQQLLSNLLGNALTHGARDQPVVVEARSAQGQLQVSVLNGGEPIAPANLARIFEPYWRPADSGARGGLGLGLHICSMIVKAHGGSLEVSSSAEAGTRFTARMPMQPSGDGFGDLCGQPQVKPH